MDTAKLKGTKGRVVRLMLVAVSAALVVGVGATLVPAPAAAPAPSFSENARTSALSDALALRSDAGRLAAAAATADMLGIQAQALHRAGDLDGMPSPVAGSASGAPSATPSSSPTAAPTTAGFVTLLAASGSRRLADAKGADGGTARLLAAVGTAQLLGAKELAASAGLPEPAFPAPAAASGAGNADGGSPSTEGRSSERDCLAGSAASTRGAGAGNSGTVKPGGADLAGALGAVGRGEAEAVYVYQVALTRLDPAAGRTAAGLLATHQGNVRAAEELSRLDCVAVPPREAGYRLPDNFAAQPTAALGSMEAGMLGVYGDLIALGTVEARHWAVEELAAAGQRARAWGVDTGALPGLGVKLSDLPELPGTAAAPRS